MCRRQRPRSCQGPISSKQPSLNEILGKGTSRSGSNEYLTPSPSHSGHIPCGLLKLKSCGLGGSNDKPQCVQAYADEKTMSPSRDFARDFRLSPRPVFSVAGEREVSASWSASNSGSSKSP